MKRSVLLMAIILVFSFATGVFADAAVGDSIVSIGANLNEEQKQMMLDEFDAPENVLTIEVTNEEEHEYLGDYVPSAQIGTRALSSAMITYTEAGSGIDVQVSDNINYITENIYKNALVTAGVEDADIQVSAPMSVTGTAALTGILKAYEVSTGEEISEDLKQVANEELVVTSELGEDIGKEEAATIINEIKIAVSENAPKNKEEVRTIVNNTINNFNISLTDDQVEKLTNMFDRMRQIDIDWDRVANEANELKDRATEYLSSEEGQNFLQRVKTWFNNFIDWVSEQFQ